MIAAYWQAVVFGLELQPDPNGRDVRGLGNAKRGCQEASGDTTF
jgi:hypothetical protein